MDGLYVHDGFWRKAELTQAERAAADGLPVVPGADDDVLLVRTRRVVPHAFPVAHGARLIGVEPTGEDEDGQVDPREILVLEEDPVPVGVPGGVIQEVVVQGHVAPHRVVHGDEWTVGVHCVPIRDAHDGPLRRPSGRAVDPVQRPLHQPRAADVGKLVEVVSARRLRDHADQIARALAGRQPLHRRQVGAAHHADPPIRPRLAGDPLDRVVSVLCVGEEEPEAPVRVPASAGVLDDEGVAPLCVLLPELRVPLVGLDVGCAHEDCRVRSGAVGQPEVGGQLDAVAHGDPEVEVLLDLCGGGGSDAEQRE